ncbi:hypothetical protein WME76_24985 [Sorangium sp. So ce119]|uniref:hypothetical protein n=1 Tax=Sorangium sp. So ce119 TaxID=3133279 RepID=UPI003F6097E7
MARTPRGDGLSIDVLGAHDQVGRATAARWLAGAREALREFTRAELVAELGLTESQYASLARLIQGRLDVSVASLLREQSSFRKRTAGGLRLA